MRILADLGFKIVATGGTLALPAGRTASPAAKINKVLEGRPHIVDAIKNGGIQLVFNTTEGPQALADSRSLRRTALLHKVPYYTTLAGAIAAARGHQGLSQRRSRSAGAAGSYFDDARPERPRAAKQL